MAEKPEILNWVDEMTQPVEEHEEVKEEEVAAEPVEETPEEVGEVESKDEEDKKSREIDPEHVKGLEKALQDERDERKKLDQAIKQQQEQFARYDELWERLNKAQEEKAKEAVPSYEDDPIGNLAYQNKQLNEQLKGVQNKTKQFEDYQTQQAQISQITQNIQASESNFAQQTSDYYDALNYLREINRKAVQPIAEAQGWTQEQITAHLGQQEFMAAANLIRQGVNPAQYAYTLASTYGYKKAEKTNGASEKEEMSEDERQKKGLELSRGSGGSNKKIDKEFVSEASPAEFQEAMREMFGQ